MVSDVFNEFDKEEEEEDEKGREFWCFDIDLLFVKGDIAWKKDGCDWIDWDCIESCWWLVLLNSSFIDKFFSDVLFVDNKSSFEHGIDIIVSTKGDSFLSFVLVNTCNDGSVFIDCNWFFDFFLTIWFPGDNVSSLIYCLLWIASELEGFECEERVEPIGESELCDGLYKELFWEDEKLGTPPILYDDVVLSVKLYFDNGKVVDDVKDVKFVLELLLVGL